MLLKRPDVILHTLHSHGHEAYYVGGCVRDLLLGRPVHDWDITTSALPEETMACFSKCIPTGLKHGTITVIEGEFTAEVTTYRTETSYADGRHPDDVVFVRSLEEDLARRDFTINAMAMDSRGMITDPFGGRVDLERNLLRCVGAAERRFREDALRMLRVLRFSAQLGFSIELETQRAMELLAGHCRLLSAERIREEMEKTLLSDRPQILAAMRNLGMLEGVLQGTGAQDLNLENLPQEKTVRWAGLCRAWPDLDLMALRMDKRTARTAMTAGRMTVPEDRLGWKRMLAQEGESVAAALAALEGKSALLQEILDSGECLSLRQLAVRGSDFPALHGPELGRHLNRLLEYVLEHPEANERKFLENFS